MSRTVTVRCRYSSRGTRCASAITLEDCDCITPQVADRLTAQGWKLGRTPDDPDLCPVHKHSATPRAEPREEPLW